MSPECIEMVRSLIISSRDYYKTRTCPKCNKSHRENRRFKNPNKINWLEEFTEKYSNWCFTCLQLEILLPEG